MYAATLLDGGGEVAVKVAHEHPRAVRRRLLHELRALEDIGPPHVPAVRASGELESGVPFVAMDFVDAPTLAELMAEGPASPARAVELGRAVLATLAAVHARGWAHLDLKPENVFITDGRAKLVDFGLVAALEGAEGPSPDVHGGVHGGTPEYMAPEQCGRSDVIDVRADLYAFGVLFYELVAGVPPFWGAPAVVREAHLSRRPKRLSSVASAPLPPGLDAVVERCLAKDPRERFESAAALDASLAQLDLTREAPSVRLDAARAASEAQGERRRAALLFFESTADTLRIQRELGRLGGQLAHASGGRAVAVFPQGDNPARLARRAAEELVGTGVARRVRLDVATVSVRLRAGGSPRYVSPLFGREERFPGPGDPHGVTLTEAARAVLAGAEGEAEHGHELEPEAVGREDLLAELVESARRAFRDRVPAVVRVLASPGQGKSHLARALRAKLHALEASPDLIHVSVLEPSLGRADQAVRELLLRTLDLPTPLPAEREATLREALAGVGASETMPAVALTLGWVARDVNDSSFAGDLRSREAAPGALRSALTKAVELALLARASRRPVVVLLDDAQHADEAALAALERASMAGVEAPLWICALGRPVFCEEHPAFGTRAAAQATHRLDPLDAESAAKLCRRLLAPAENVPGSAVERLVERTQAIPLLLVELTRGLHRAGLVRRQPRGGAYYLATDELDRVPDLPLVDWQAQGELDALPGGLRSHAHLLSLLGDEVVARDTEGVLRRLEDVGADVAVPLDAKIGIQQLVQAGVLVADGGTGRITFRHALVREAIAKQVPEELRASIHRAARDHYKDRDTEPDRDRTLAQLAFHAAASGDPATATAAYLDLAERMRRRHAYVHAERAYSRALEQTTAREGALALRAHWGRGLMRYRTGRYHDALEDLSFARALAHADGDVELEAEILLDEATALDWMLDYPASSERVADAERLLQAARPPRLEAPLLLGVGRSAHRMNQEEDAARLLEAACLRAGELGDEGYETLVIALILLGFIHPAVGRLEDARRALDRAISLCESHGDDLHLGAAITNRATLWLFLGEHDKMVADMERGLSLAHKLGQASIELTGEANLAEFLYLLDQADDAEPHVQRAIALERRRTGGPIRPCIALLLARAQHYAGDLAAARASAERIRAAHHEGASSGQTDLMMSPAEEVLCDMVDLATREARSAEWDELEARSARSSVGMEQIEVLEARALAALRFGRPDEAVVRWERALSAAERIPNAMGARLARGLARARQAVAAARLDATPRDKTAYTVNEMPKPTNQA